MAPAESEWRLHKTRHPWANDLMESGTSPGPANFRHHEAVTGCYVWGFALQGASLPFDTAEELADVAEDALEPLRASA